MMDRFNIMVALGDVIGAVLATLFILAGLVFFGFVTLPDWWRSRKALREVRWGIRTRQADTRGFLDKRIVERLNAYTTTEQRNLLAMQLRKDGHEICLTGVNNHFVWIKFKLDEI